MRINIIGNFNPNTGLQQDALLLRGILTHVFGEDVHIGRVPFMYPQCGYAAVNIFLEVVNPSLFAYANKNIWIPNLEWTYKSWKPYVGMFDEIWTKTHEATYMFRRMAEGTETIVHHITWTSIDKVMGEPKNYSKAIVLVGKNIYRNPKQLLRAYLEIEKTDPDLYKKLPDLYIPYAPTRIHIHVPDEIKARVHLLDKELTDTQYADLLYECGLAICLSAAEGFGHAVNEAMSAGCNLLLSPIRPFKDDLTNSDSNVFWTGPREIAENRECFGLLTDVSVDSIIQCLRDYVQTGFRVHREISKDMRQIYERRHTEFIQSMEQRIRQSIPTTTHVNTLPKEEDLPDVSIVTITRDRRVFMPLAKYSYMIQSYPEEKLEWVIVDDGDDPIEDTLIGVPNVKYVRCDRKMTIGEKRNLGVENAMYDIVCMMDDDDVYPNNSVLQRVAMLQMSPAKECGFCTTIPCYDICKFSSFMNVPPYTLGMSQRVSEATLVFTKAFWNQRNFLDDQVAEGEAFIQGREQTCREISPQEVIVSLVHPRNTSSRRLPTQKEPNGCHYGFNEQLFALVTQIGQELAPSNGSTSTSSPSPVLPKEGEELST